MSMRRTSWLEWIGQGLGRTVHNRRSPSRRRAKRLTLECLERRSMLTTITVIGSDDGPGQFNPKDNTDTTLRGALGHIHASGDTIQFQDTGWVIHLKSPLAIGNSVTIFGSDDNGTGPVTIDGGNKVGCFIIGRGASVTLDHLNITGGSAASGGAVRNEFGTLFVVNCTLSGNSSTADGGAILNQGGKTLITGSTLENNKSLGDGGAIANRIGSVAVSETKFLNNTATKTGGAISNQAGRLSIVGTTSDMNLSGNKAARGGGGAIFNDEAGTATITHATLSNNSATGYFEVFDDGGAIRNSGRMTIEGSLLAGNTSVRNGGAIENDGVLTIERSTLSGNTADASGGAIGNDNPRRAHVTIRLCTLKDNTATGAAVRAGADVGDGGALFNKATMMIHDSTISGNKAENAVGVGSSGGAGGAIFNKSVLTIEGSTISDNTASGDGGAISCVPLSTLTISGSTLSGNKASGNGGAIRLSHSIVHIGTSTLRGNSATAGGAISTELSTLLTINRSTLSGNSATEGDLRDGDGGALYDAGGPSATLTIVNSTFSGNSAMGSGGAIFSSGKHESSRIASCTLSGNSAATGGGIFARFYNEKGKLHLLNSIVAANTGTNPDVSGPLAESSHNNLIGDGTGMTGITSGSQGNKVGTSAAPINPLLAPLADNGGPTQTMLPQAGSPVINAGDPNATNLPEFDQRGPGFPRVIGGRLDIGAVETS
jgi:predicted outer membrane repeat protein